MNWTKFNSCSDSDSVQNAFEAMCNQLFENWCIRTYKDKLSSFRAVNGAGGDGGIESYARLRNDKYIGVQAKWFPSALTSSQINQIKKSINTAMSVREEICHYIVCIPRNLSSKTAKSDQCEEVKWNNLLKNLSEQYPNLKVELWDEYRIEKELQEAENSGIHNYWFKNPDISQACIVNAFKISKSTWLDNKYVPDLHVSGDIDKLLMTSLGDIDTDVDCKNSLNDFYKHCEQATHYLDRLASVSEHNENYLISIITQCCSLLIAIMNEINNINGAFAQESDLTVNLNFNVLDNNFEEFFYKLDDLKKPFNRTFHFSDALKKLRTVIDYDLSKIMNFLFIRFNNENIIIGGEPGTGKTHGISALSEKLIAKGIHLPILIQAKTVVSEMNWKDIISSTLRLSNDWSEDEMFSGLISLANRKRLRLIKSEQNICLLPKILIIVDGIDEKEPYEHWINKIKESKLITKRFPRIRFCFLSRPHVFNGFTDKDIYFKRLSSLGDTPTYKLFDNYINAYDIRLADNHWVKYSIGTPLELKFFCETFEGQNIDTLQVADVSISGLLKRKIKNLEEEFCEKELQNNDVSNQYILKSIQVFSELMLDSNQIDKDTAIQFLSKRLYGDIRISDKVLLFLQKYGIIYTTVKQNKGFLGDTYFYSAGIQSYFDYAVVTKLIETYSSPDKIDFLNYKYLTENMIYILSVLSIRDYDYLISYNESFEKSTYNHLNDNLISLALRNIKPEKCEKYKNILIEAAYINSDSLKYLVNNICLPLSRHRKHPFGAMFLNEFLCNFDTPAERDLYWSVPPYITNQKNKTWYNNCEIDLLNEEHQLNVNDMADDLPTIFAWALSTVDNHRRSSYRKELMRWSLISPYEYYKLFVKFADVNDPQIRGDIFLILMSCLFEVRDAKLLETASEYLMQNVLDVNQVDRNRNITIRFCATSILRKACQYDLFEQEKINNYLPPYTVNTYEIQLSEEALLGTRMSGYKSVHYDLARYVLMENIIGKYPVGSRDYRGQFKLLINNIGKHKNEFKDISEEQFILSAAYAYLLSQGWTEEKFDSFTSQEDYEVDIAIQKRYYPASHGSQSKVMTFCEKYIWQARSEIYGFLADRLCCTYHAHGEIPSIIDDYCVLDSFVNPMEELYYDGNITKEKKDSWHIPEREKVFLGAENSSIEELKEIVESRNNLNYKEWLFIENNNRYNIHADELIMLYTHSCFEDAPGLHVNIFANALVVPKKNFDEMIYQSLNCEVMQWQLCDISNLNGGYFSTCCISPSFLINLPWIKRYEGSISDGFAELEISALVDCCSSHILGVDDISYYFPSELAREAYDVDNTDGYLFYNNNRIVAEYHKIGENYATKQNLLIGEKLALFQFLEKQDLVLFWVVTEIIRESSKGKERLGEFYIERRSTEIVYIEDDNFQTVEIEKSFDAKYDENR